MMTNDATRSKIQKVRDLQTDAVFLNALAQGAGILQDMSDDDARAGNALVAIIEAIEVKAEKLADDLGRLALKDSTA